MTLTPEKLDEIDRLSKRLLSTGWRAWDAQDVGVAVNALPALVAAARERDALRDALKAMVGSVCGPTGFAEAVRHNTGLALPWESLDIAERKARAALEVRHE